MRNPNRQESREWLLPSLCLISSLFGILLIYSATRYDEALHRAVGKQLIALAGGVLLCLLLSILDIRKLVERGWLLLLGGNIGLLLLLIPLGQEDGTGNKSWLALPGGIFNFQPAEVVKLGFLLLLAKQLGLLREKGLNRPRAILFLAGHALSLCALLYLVSGDIGMVAVYLAIYFVMLWAGGVHPLWLLGELGVFAGGVALLWNHLPSYIRLRILVVFDHDLDPLGKGFQQGRSLLTIGSGQVFGQGYLHGLQTQSSSPSALPARHTDFIFSVAGEEWGLIGCIVILALLSGIVLRCMLLARCSGSPLFSDVAMGLAGLFLSQVIFNVGMCLYLLPVVGVTLPFFSYGGSSLLASFGGIGIFLSLWRERQRV